MQVMMAQGRRVIDIGPDAANANFPGVTSDNYAVELQEIENAGYRNIIQPYPDPIALGPR